MYTTSAVVKLKPEQNSGLNMIQTQDLCNTVAVLYQLSYQAIWELAGRPIKALIFFQALISQLLKLCT